MKFEGFEASHNQRLLKKVVVQAGACAGFGLALIVIVFKRYSGFFNLPQPHFANLWPLMILNGTLAGAFSGFMCIHWAATWSSPLKRYKKLKIYVVLLVTGFCVAVLLQQLSARNALSSPMWDDSLGRFTGGPLGEPNFETIATGILCGVYYVSLTSILSRLPMNRESIFLSGLKTTIPGVSAWCAVYCLYLLLINLNIVPKYHIPWSLAAIFIVDFPHPERVVLYIFFCLIFTSIILKYVQINDRALRRNGSKKHQKFLEQVVAVIDKNMSNPDFGPQQLAEALGLSKGHLNRKLNDIVGVTTTRFIVKARLKKAALLIQDDYDNITRIAYQVGFNNISYFNRSFKKEFNLTPSQYRQQN